MIFRNTPSGFLHADNPGTPLKVLEICWSSNRVFFLRISFGIHSGIPPIVYSAISVYFLKRCLQICFRDLSRESTLSFSRDFLMNFNRNYIYARVSPEFIKEHTYIHLFAQQTFMTRYNQLPK